MNGLHENEPAEYEPMVAFPNASYVLEIGSNESRQISKGHHHEQGHPRTSET
jgi:hypothetical protein